MTRVAIYTDNDFEKVNGVTTTLKAVLRCTPPDIDARLYTMSDDDVTTPTYVSSRSIGIGLPRYPQMKIYWPRLGPLSRALSRDSADVVHLTTPGPVGLAGRWLASRYRRPMVGSFHTNLGDYACALGGGSAFGRGAGRLLDDYMRWLYGGCSRVLVPSTGTRQALIELGYDPQRLSVWSRGVDAEVFSPDRRSAALRQSWGVDHDTPVLLYVGRLSREKGLHRLIDISRSLAGRHLKHQLVIAGDGPLLCELSARLPSAIFCGEVTHQQVGAVMASADVFVFPSDTDTFGNVVLEAQACGLPAVVSALGGPKEAISDDVTGFVVPAGREELWTTKVAALLQHADLRRAFAEEARRRAASRDWRQTLAPLYQEWRDAAARARATQHVGMPAIAPATRL